MIIDLDDVRACERVRAGGKASQLAVLARGGFPVPRGFVITTDELDRALVELELEQPIAALLRIAAEPNLDVLERLAGPLGERVRAAPLPAGLAAAIAAKMVHEPFAGDARFAVRSSAVDEDRGQSSVAGQYETVLGVTAAEVGRAVAAVWASMLGARALCYLGVRGTARVQGAVLVQRLVEARSAGVAFTRDPVTGAGDRVLINANYGLGDSVASGRVSPDSYTVIRNDERTVLYVPGCKDVLSEPDHRGGYGVRERPCLPELRERPCLSEAEARQVAELAETVEAELGEPVDIEWAMDTTGIELLQARPITALPAPAVMSVPAAVPASPPGWQPELNTLIDPRYPLYSSGNISEILPGCLTPLSWSAIGPVLERAFRNAPEELGIGNHLGPGYVAMGFFYHRPYLNVSYLFEVADEMPGMTRDTITEELVAPVENPQPVVTWGDLRPRRLVRMARIGAMSLHKTATLERDIGTCYQRYQQRHSDLETAGFGDFPLPKLMDELLCAAYQEHACIVHLWTSQLALTAFSMLRKLTRRWLHDRHGALAATMVTGIGTLPSADPAFGIYELSRLVVREHRLGEMFAAQPDDRYLYSALAGDEREPVQAFCRALHAFLAEFGHRAVCEAEYRNRCWREDPAQVLAHIRNYLSDGATSPHIIRARQRLAGERALASALATLPWHKRWVLTRLLAAARRYIAARERMKNLIILQTDLDRQLIAVIRDRLVGSGLLGCGDDIYFLQYPELREVVDGTLDRAAICDVVARRRRDFAWSEAVQVPKLQQEVPRILAMPEPLPGRERDELAGIGVSPGQAVGRARVVLDPRRDSHLEPGEILVAPVTDLGWTPLFLNAAGLVVEIGGLLSHGSIVAREYGLPAVVGVPGATQAIRTGDLIHMDGTTGRVHLVVRDAAAPERARDNLATTRDLGRKT